jgi:hypothetical protein
VRVINRDRQTGRHIQTVDRQIDTILSAERGRSESNQQRRTDRQILYYHQKEEGVRVINIDRLTDRYCSSRKRKALDRKTDTHPME